MAKKKHGREPDGAAGGSDDRFRKNVIRDWLAETKAEKPDMAPLKFSDAPTKRPEGRIIDRDSDRARGIEPEPVPRHDDDEESSDSLTYEPRYDPDEEEELDFGSSFDPDDDGDDDSDFGDEFGDPEE